MTKGANTFNCAQIESALTDLMDQLIDNLVGIQVIQDDPFEATIFLFPRSYGHTPRDDDQYSIVNYSLPRKESLSSSLDEVQ